MDFLKKLLGVAAGAAKGATQPTRDNRITNSMVLGGLLPAAMRENRPQLQAEPKMQLPMRYMNRVGENLSQEELARRTAMQTGQYAQQFVGRRPANPIYEDEIYPQYELPQAQHTPAGMGEGFYDPYNNILKGRGGLSGPNTQQSSLDRLLGR